MGERDDSYTGWAAAFLIFARYERGYGDSGVGMDAHAVYAGPNPDRVSEEDKDELARYGWFASDKFTCFFRML